MKKKDKRKEKNKEELKDYLKELSTKDSISNEEADRLTEMIDTLVFGSKTERILSALASFVFKYIILFVVSLIASAFFLNQLLLDRYYIFLIAGSVAFLLTLSETIFSSMKGFNIKWFLTSLVIIAIGAVIFNSIIPTFTFASIWIAYLIVIEVIYNLLMLSIFKRKLKS